MSQASPSAAPTVITALAHVVGLSAFAFLQPVLDLLARTPQFLVAHHATRGDLGWIVLLVGVAVPAAIAVPLVVSRLLGRRVFGWAHAAVITVLVAFILRPLLFRLESLPEFGATGLAVAAGVGVAALRPRSRVVRGFLVLSSLALPLFVLVFVARSPKDPRPSTTPPEVAIDAPAVTTDKDVVLVVFDGLPLASLVTPDQEIDRHRYPNFARLAAQSLWFRRATTVSDRTLFSIPSIVTGLRTNPHQQATLKHHPNSLFTLLARTHRYVVEEPRTSLCPEELLTEPRPAAPERVRAMVADLRVLMSYQFQPPSRRGDLPTIAQSWRDFHTPTRDDGEGALARQARVDDFHRYLEAIGPHHRPTFYFLHTLLPHAPFVHYPSGRRFSRDGKEPSGQGDEGNLYRDGDRQAALHSHQRHLLQVGYVDRLLGELLDRLEAADIFQDAVVVVVADHGESFRPHDQSRDVTDTNYAAIMRIPLFIKLPGQEEGGVVDEDLETIDLLPTLAGLIGLEVSFAMQGTSYLTADPSEGRELSCWGGSHLVRTDRATLQEQFLQVVRTRDRQLGSGPDPDRLFKLGAYGSLVGREVASVDHGEPSPLRVELTGSAPLDEVDPSRIFLPGEIAGFVRGDRAGLQQDLAVAVNDVVWATTRAYLPLGNTDEAVWAALVPERALHAGVNVVKVFAVSGPPEQPTLHPVSALPPGGARFLGLQLGARRLHGVEEEGFFPPKGRKFRWMGRQSRLRVPLGEGETPRRVRVILAAASDPTDHHSIRINGVETFRGPVPTKGWRQDFALDDIPVTDHVEIVFECVRTTAAPSEGKVEMMQTSLALMGLWVE